MACSKCISSGNPDPCVLCNGNPYSLKALKKHAKRGRAWAQFALARRYETGNALTQSYENSRLWYTKAARQNHPDALYNLGCLYKEGVVGGRVDLAKGRDFIRSAMDIYNRSGDEGSLVSIARYYLTDCVIDEQDGIKQALDILIPLAGTDPKTSTAPIDGRFQLAYALFSKGDFQASYSWYCSTVLASVASEMCTCVHVWAPSIYNAMLCCGEITLDLKAQRKLWARLAQKESISVELDANERLERTQKIISVLRDLRQLRDTCGGCGVAFEGKERKFCRGCKTFCYCSRECQKMHWNRKKNGHREDCKGATKLKKKLKEARRQSKAS